MAWGNYTANLPIITHLKERIRKQVEVALSADKISAGVYQNAANFYFEWDKDYTKALSNVSKAIEINSKSYPLWILKAKINLALGDKISAKADAQQCAVLATQNKNDDYVRTATDFIKGCL